MNLPRRAVLVVLAVTAAANLALLVHYHDRFWWPTDDGIYAHVASRLAAGEVMNRDIEEGHPGYSHFLHRAMFGLFGPDFVSLRYPLIAAAFLQGILAVVLLARAGWPEALLGGLAAVVLGVLQFLNPQPHWYCSLLACAIAAVLTLVPREQRWRIPALGFLVAAAFLFRQLTGVFLLAATVTVVLSEPGDARTATSKLAARLFLGGMALAMLAYLVTVTNVTGFLLFGVWPLALVGAALLSTTASNRQIVRTLGALVVGAILALLPLLAYHTVHGSLGWWFQDVATRSMAAGRLPYLNLSRYWHLPVLGLAGARESARLLVNAIYFCLVLLLASAVGVLSLHRLRTGHRLAPLCVVAIFYGLVSLFNQIPIYLHYTAALSLAALLLLTAGRGRAVRATALATAGFLLAVGLRFQAAQPLSRGISGTVAGTTIDQVPSGLDRCALDIDPRDRDVYRAVVARIHATTAPGQAIFVFPNHPELYFLSDRPNPFRFHSSALGIQHVDELPPVLARLALLRPRLIVHVPADPSTTDLSATLLAGIKGTHRHTDTIGPFELYELGEMR